MKFALGIILLALAVLIGPVVWQFTHYDPQAVPTSGLPWQIETLPSGESKVFDLTLGRSTLADASSRFGAGMQLAIVAEPNEAGNLEAYYESVTAGFVAGRLIVTADLPKDVINAMRERAAKTEYMQSTTRKATLAAADMPAALAAPIRALAFIPSANLDEDIVLQRFGQPAERIRVNEHLEHLLYPAKGLDVVLDSKGKVHCWASEPITLPLPTIVELASADGLACARDAQGGVWCWGYDRTREHPVPATAPLAMAVPASVQIVAGLDHLCSRSVAGEGPCAPAICSPIFTPLTVRASPWILSPSRSITTGTPPASKNSSIR